MTNWKYKVKVTHLFTKNEDHESIKKSMKAIYNVLKKEPCFKNFAELNEFKKIPKGNNVLGPLDYANKLISRMYDYADYNYIWLE